MHCLFPLPASRARPPRTVSAQVQDATARMNSPGLLLKASQMMTTFIRKRRGTSIDYSRGMGPDGVGGGCGQVDAGRPLHCA